MSRQRIEDSLTDSQKFGRELFGLFLIFWALLLLLSLLSFDANDPSLNHVKTHAAVRNKAGLFGAYVAGFLNEFFGVAALLWSALFAALGAAHISPSYIMRWWRWCGFFLLTLCLLVTGSAWDFSLGDLSGGGMVGKALHDNASRYLSSFGAMLLWFFVLVTGLQLALNVSWFSLAARLLSRPQTTSLGDRTGKTVSTAGGKTFSNISFSGMKSFWEYCRNILGNIRPRTEKLPPLHGGGSMEQDEVLPAPENFNKTKELDAQPRDAAAAAQSDASFTQPSSSPARAPRGDKSSPSLPKLDLLRAPASEYHTQKEDLEIKGKTLMACLDDFAVQGELVRITPGPVVTMFEVRPAKGVRVSRIAVLSDDLARSLKAVAVRIQAPIPGSDTVGIEIPNTHRESVNFRELASTENFVKGCGPLTMILGKDIAGQPVMADLARMPHLLVAGATGAGKSVCLNAILISLLYKTQPQDMQLLLIDPKRIEMAVYADEPHLVHPVVTEMHEAQNALNWAVHEMERRYMAIKRLGVRHVTDYNKKLACYRNELPPDFADLEHLPYLVIVIDELADLMVTSGRDVEKCIVRLAQLARAAGIHLILATQRPSVDVVTGLIKANFPCRISFQVTFKHDSRTILDQVGAEHLLGRGDMLYKPGSGRLQRLHGPFL
ncbi:MAG: DNA translocase FtsK 4TM domain-containing protein, partial [Desulfovibrio sp.]|nr:DNA translocase FtsK 4TM domain-containing protein [Desulfovibrio sp.]